MNRSKHNQMIRLFFIMLLALSLFSCHQKKTINNHPAQWSNVKTWAITGKMALRDGENNGSGRISWQNNGNSTYAQFKAPLGQGSWKITEDQQQAILESSKQGTKYGVNAEQLISQELGWHFPWQQLSLWLRGVKSAHQLNDKFHNINGFTDQGWAIVFDKWQQTSIGSLPKKISASKPPYSVKLIIYDWQIQ